MMTFHWIEPFTTCTDRFNRNNNNQKFVYSKFKYRSRWPFLFDKRFIFWGLSTKSKCFCSFDLVVVVVVTLLITKQKQKTNKKKYFPRRLIVNFMYFGFSVVAMHTHSHTDLILFSKRNCYHHPRQQNSLFSLSIFAIIFSFCFFFFEWSRAQTENLFNAIASL